VPFFREYVYFSEILMHDPLRTLVLAVVRQAMIDYYRDRGSLRVEAESYLRGDGRELWVTLGLDEDFLDSFLDCPWEVGCSKVAGRRLKR